MTEAMPFLQKAILLSYAPRSFQRGDFFPLFKRHSAWYTGVKTPVDHIQKGGKRCVSHRRTSHDCAGAIYAAAPGRFFRPGRAGNPKLPVSPPPAIAALPGSAVSCSASWV